MNVKPLKQLVPGDVYGVLESYSKDGMRVENYRDDFLQYEELLKQLRLKRQEKEREENSK